MAWEQPAPSEGLVFAAQAGLHGKVYRLAPKSKIPWRIDPRAGEWFERCMAPLMHIALGEWPLLQLHSEYPHVSKDEPFAFQVTYEDADKMSPRSVEHITAIAFFPSDLLADKPAKLKIYPAFFQLAADERITTLVHEIGHTLGIRHDLMTPSERESCPSVELTPPQELSVMHYNPTLCLPERQAFIHFSDVLAVLKLYGLRRGERVNGWPVVDITPRLHPEPGGLNPT